MPKSARVRVQDVRAVFQLVGECRELGDDSAGWRQHWFAGLARLIGAGVVMGAELTGVRAGRTAHSGLADWGWANGFNRGGWERAAAEMAADSRLSRTPALAEYLRRMLVDDGVCLSRADLLADGAWYRSWDYENLHVGVGIDHTLWCFRSLPGIADEFNGLLMGRSLGEPDFSARQKAIIREAQQAIGPLVGGLLARFQDPSPALLAPRVRQVLKCLLEGDADKQIAARLGLSGFTVNGYVKLIFKHFGVTSRPELLARWIRRGWGCKFAWVESP